MQKHVLFSCIVLLSGIVFVAASKDDAARNAFIKAFAQKMQSNPDTATLLEVVNIPLTKTAELFKMVYENYLKKGGESNDEATNFGEYDVKLLIKYFPKLNTEKWVKSVGKEIAKLMIRYGKMNKNNATKLASQAAADYAEESKRFDAKNSSSGKWAATFYGNDKFLSRYGLNFAKLAPEVAKDITDEFACDFSGKCK